LAQLPRADLLPEGWIAPAEVRQLRALLRHRAGLVRLGTRQRNRIHAVVADFGYDRSGSYLSGPGRGWLAGLELPAVSREIVTGALAVTGGLALLTGRIDGELHQHAEAGPRAGTLTTLPGMGQFTALVMLAEIGDITRFPSARKLASWAGLTPAVRGSDLHVRHGHIPGRGSAWLRWVMNQAAQTARRSPEFAATYQTTAKKRGKKIATIAISRKLLTRAWHLLAAGQAPGPVTPDASMATAAHPQTGRVTKPRASSLSRHEPATGRARSSDRAARSRTHGQGSRPHAGGAGWVLARPLRQPSRGPTPP
jgi:transposase